MRDQDPPFQTLNEKQQFSIRIHRHDNTSLYYHYDKKGGKQIVTSFSESKVMCTSSVNKFTAETKRMR